MSDFIFSRINIARGKITKQILSIYNQNYPSVKEFHGDWGSLGVSQNLYNGFNPYENDQLIALVLGGPLLMFRDNSFLRDKDSFEGTKAVLDRWIKGELKLDSDLSGPFVILIVNKDTKEIICITDLMSFIPVYFYSDSSNIVLSTHVDAMAITTEQKNILDEVSLADFILNGIVTFPYTTYKNIFQIRPASEHFISKEALALNTREYWLPLEKSKYKSINNASNELRRNLEIYTDKIINETDNIAQFISGGEDSRTLSGLLKLHPRNGYIFLDKMNREGNIAKKIAAIYNVNIKIFTRKKLHYLDILPNCSDLVGSGSEYKHAHTYGFHNICNLQSYDAVFGGLFSDALLKGARIKKSKLSKKLPFLPEVKNNNYKVTDSFKNSLFKIEILEKIASRRKDHFNYVKKYRKESAEEWFELWPSSMNLNIPNMHVNRRLFRSYEPFMSSEVVKMSVCIPQKWKLNRKLFHRAAKPYLKPSKWILHADGWFPAFPWHINSFVRFSIWTYRQVGKRVGWIKGNQGPWGDWKLMVHSTEWNEFLESKNYLNKLPIKSTRKSLPELLENDKLSIHQYANLTQVLYQINKNNTSKL